ncbi:MAG: hypothetical protein IPK10_17645 [Bacteroidetes bacterium]|nr:hypothetical protein [Bacteroidota bacterium]
MNKLGYLCLVVGFLFFGQMGYGQELTNLRNLKLMASKDTIILDSLSVIPGSFVLMKGDKVIPASDYFLDEFASKFFWKGSMVDSLGSMDSLSMVFRVYPMSFSKPRYLRDRRVLDKRTRRQVIFFNGTPI